MDSNRLRQLIWEPRESAKLDFKVEFYKINEPRPSTKPDEKKWSADKEQQWAELVKDVIALANGNIGTAEKTGYLVIGAGDKLKANGKPTLRNVSETMPTQTEILQKVNSYCYPKIPDLQCEDFIVDSVNTFVISIPPSPYLYRLLNQLKTPKQEYSPHVVLIRRKDGENTYVASPDEIEAIENEKNGETRSLPPWVQLEVDSEGERRISKQKLRNNAWRGYFIIAFGILLSLALLFFWGALLFSTGLFTIVLSFPIPLYFLSPYYEEMHLYLKTPRNKNEAWFIGQGSFMQEDTKGFYLIRTPTACCIYPCCNQGKIVIKNAPPMEVSRRGRTLIGVCTIAGRDHSYHVDYNYVATPAQLDWSVPSAK